MHLVTVNDYRPPRQPVDGRDLQVPQPDRQFASEPDGPGQPAHRVHATYIWHEQQVRLRLPCATTWRCAPVQVQREVLMHAIIGQSTPCSWTKRVRRSSSPAPWTQAARASTTETARRARGAHPAELGRRHAPWPGRASPAGQVTRWEAFNYCASSARGMKPEKFIKLLRPARPEEDDRAGRARRYLRDKRMHSWTTTYSTRSTRRRLERGPARRTLRSCRQPIPISSSCPSRRRCPSSGTWTSRPRARVTLRDKIYKEFGQERPHPQHPGAAQGVLAVQRDVDYVVQDGRVMIVDEHTGRLVPGRRWSDGIHQAVEAEGRRRGRGETQTLMTITLGTSSACTASSPA